MKKIKLRRPEFKDNSGKGDGQMNGTRGDPALFDCNNKKKNNGFLEEVRKGIG